jgi:sulfatase modifying factor 1
VVVMRRRIAWVCAALGTATVLAGCAKLLGIEDPNVVTSGEAGSDAPIAEWDSAGEAPDDGGHDAAEAGMDAAHVDSSVPEKDADAAMVAPSCALGGFGENDCGPHANESCCASPSVAGGTFFRSYDAVNYTDAGNPATVSSFRLDRFEVTVGRFRVFVSALATGWFPAAGSGKHAYLGGGGLNGGSETGWDPTWSALLTLEGSTWSQVLSCGDDATWTDSPQSADSRAMNCVDWYEAYAFCIWDGGFLPTEAEWNYAAAGGSDQRVYPWSQPPNATTISCMNANFRPLGSTCQTGLTPVGYESPWGDGANNKWGQADLSGNAFEWGLDWFEDPYATTSCTDCTDVTNTGSRVLRGGSYVHAEDWATASHRGYLDPTLRAVDVGLRCARAP